MIPIDPKSRLLGFGKFIVYNTTSSYWDSARITFFTYIYILRLGWQHITGGNKNHFMLNLINGNEHYSVVSFWEQTMALASEFRSNPRLSVQLEQTNRFISLINENNKKLMR